MTDTSPPPHDAVTREPTRASLSSKVALELRSVARELYFLPRNVLVNGLAASNAVPKYLRLAIYRAMGFDVDWRCWVAPGVRLVGSKLRIGAGSTVNFGCIIDCTDQVTIGKRVGIGFRVQFLTAGHETSDPLVRAGRGKVAPITVGDGSYIASGVEVLPGVTIGAGCLVAPGSVVTHDCDAHGMYGGAPATRLKDLPR